MRCGRPAEVVLARWATHPSGGDDGQAGAYAESVDWTIFHWLNGSLDGHAFIQDEIADFANTWAVPLFAVALAALWFLDRPGRPPRWKLACLAGATAAGLGLLVSQPIGWLWFRERPFAAHPDATLLLAAPSPDPSFPSDHAVAAFGIAFAVAFCGRRMGALFLAGATLVALSRVFVGLHYPGDIAAGMLLGLACAFGVMRFGRRPLLVIVAFLSRLTDPLMSSAWDARDRVVARRRAVRG